jgi:hypothetical protein
MAKQLEHYAKLQTFDSLPFQEKHHVELSLLKDSPLNIIARGIGSSSTSVSMNTSISNNEDKNRIETLLTLHKKAKFWVGYGRKCVPWAFLCCERWGFSQL